MNSSESVFLNCINWHTSSIRNSFRWHIIGKSECSSHCGQGHRSLDVHCMRYSVHKGQTAPVDDRHCSDQLKPPAREPCHGACVLARWHYSEWSQVQVKSITYEKLLLPPPIKYLLKYTLNYAFLCVSTFFLFCFFNQCSRSCGGGERSRQSYCMNNFGHRLADRECQERPQGTIENCNEFPCPSWATSEWSEVTLNTRSLELS